MPTPTDHPALEFAPELLLRAQGVRAVFFDLDDMLSGTAFNRHDVFGLKLLQQAGVQVLLFSGSGQVSAPPIAATPGIRAVQWAASDYGESADKVLRELDLPWPEVAAMGSDWPDLCLLQRAGFSAAPADAHCEVLVAADWVSAATAGHGAVRDLCDLLLVAAGQYAKLLRSYQT